MNEEQLQEIRSGAIPESVDNCTGIACPLLVKLGEQLVCLPMLDYNVFQQSGDSTALPPEQLFGYVFEPEGRDIGQVPAKCPQSYPDRFLEYRIWQAGQNPATA